MQQCQLSSSLAAGWLWWAQLQTPPHHVYLINSSCKLQSAAIFLSVGMSAIWLCLASICPPPLFLCSSTVSCLEPHARLQQWDLADWLTELHGRTLVFYISRNLWVNELLFAFQCFLIMLMNLINKDSTSTNSGPSYQKSELTLWKLFKKQFKLLILIACVVWVHY